MRGAKKFLGGTIVPLGAMGLLNAGETGRIDSEKVSRIGIKQGNKSTSTGSDEQRSWYREEAVGRGVVAFEEERKRKRKLRLESNKRSVKNLLV